MVSAELLQAFIVDWSLASGWSGRNIYVVFQKTGLGCTPMTVSTPHYESGSSPCVSHAITFTLTSTITNPEMVLEVTAKGMDAGRDDQCQMPVEYGDK